jgi:hypothetical protein
MLQSTNGSNMTQNRDIPVDQAETRRLLNSIGADPFAQLDYVSWLGHTGGGGLADALLLIGATEAQLRIARPNSLNQHLDHLRREHGLDAPLHDGIYKLVVPGD